MCAFAAAEVVADMQTPRHLISGHKAGDAWCGANMVTALHMGAVSGWPEAVPLAVAAYDRLTAKRLQSRIPVPVMADEPGDEIDVAAYLSGDDPFVTQSAGSTLGAGRGAVVIRHSLFASAMCNTEAIVTRGLITAAIAHLLETSGVQVAVDVDMYATNHNGGVDYSMDLECRIKEFGVPLDLPRLVYWLAHPSALRRIVFAVTSAHFHNHLAASHVDDAAWLRVSDALVGNPDPVEAARVALAAVGIELEG